jgi:tetratricopeptide (TPR) repeat protein
MPAWALVVLILALIGVLIWAGDALLRSRPRLPGTLQSETALARAGETPTTELAPPSPTPQPSVDARAQSALTVPARRLALSEPDEPHPCTPAQDLVTADLALGISAYKEGNLEEAEALLRKTLAAGEQMGTACSLLQAHTYLYLGNLSALQGEYEAALLNYQAGLDLADSAIDQALLLTNQASVQYAQGDLDDALAAANAAIDRAPELANAYYHRATVYRVLEQGDEAMQDLDQALRLDPDHARAYASRGLLYHNAGAFEDALKDYGRSLGLDPGAAEVYLNRGGTFATLGDMEAALQDYGQALALQPDDVEAYYNRGTVYAILERYPEALQDMDRALEIDPTFAQVYGNRGLIYKTLGETEAAIADLETFLELTDNPEWRSMIEQHLAELKSAK